MNIHQSYTKHEHQVVPTLRERLSHAESVEDVRKFFVYTMGDFLSLVLDEELRLHPEDITLTPHGDKPFTVSKELKDKPGFQEAWDCSDMKHIMTRLAESAVHRFRHLEKSPEKTESKIRGH